MSKTDTPITDLFESLLESADVPRHVMLKACRAAERAAIDAARCSGRDVALINHRRKVDAERQKIKRDKTRKPSADSASAENSLFLSSDIDSEPKGLRKEERALTLESADAKPKKFKGTKLPPDWQPNSKHYDLAADLHFSEADVQAYAAEMRNWCVQENHRPITTKSNWDAAFAGWMRRAAAKNNGRRPPNGPSMADIAGGKFL